MRRRLLTAVLTLVLIGAVAFVAPTSSRAQDVPSTGVPTQDIIPRPNTGHAPTEAGDRGGALQLAHPGAHRRGHRRSGWST